MRHREWLGSHHPPYILLGTKLSQKKRKFKIEREALRMGGKKVGWGIIGSFVVMETRSQVSVKGKRYDDEGNNEEYC